MDTIQLNIEKEQFVEMLQTLDDSDKLAIYKIIKKLLFNSEMENVLNFGSAEELSMEEITEIVDEVRQEMYEQGEQYI